MQVKYAVLTRISTGEWCNIWTEFSDEEQIVPTLFDSFDEAFEELKAHLKDSEEFRALGYGSLGPEDYKVSKLVGDNYEDIFC